MIKHLQIHRDQLNEAEIGILDHGAKQKKKNELHEETRNHATKVL